MYRPLRPGAATTAVSTSVLAAIGLPVHGPLIALLLATGPCLIVLGFFLLRARIQAKATER